VIYPALTYLHEIGLSSVEQQGTRKLYSITPEGKTHLEENRANAEAILDLWSELADEWSRCASNLKRTDQQKERFMPNTLLNETFKSVIQDERVRAVIQRLEAERRGARGRRSKQ
jgi:DNA-binding PadR family transcriptional regulator